MKRSRTLRWLAAAGLVITIAGPGARPTIGQADPVGPARRVRVLHAEEPALSRPGRVAWLPDSGQFLLVEEGAFSAGAPAALVSHIGDALASLTLTPAAGVAAELAYDASSGRLLLLDAARHRVLRAPLDGIGVDGARPSWVDVPALPALQPGGVAVDPVTGAFWVLDPAGRRLIHVAPDPLAATEELAMRRARVTSVPIAVEGGARLEGLALNPADGLLYVADRNTLMLLSLDPQGRAVVRHDLAAAGVAHPRGMVFAPSGDLTDDPAALSLYILDGPDGTRPHGHLVEVSLALSQAPAAAATIVSSALVHTIDTSLWSPPSPDPSGLAYDATRNRLLVSDGEVEEMTIWHGANYFESSLSGALLATSDLTSFTIEPTGVAWVPSGLQTVFSDDDARKVFVVTLGADARPGTADDAVRSFSTTAFGSGDPEGVTLDPGQSRLFIADGVNAEVYEVRAGANGIFDGVAPGGDDQVTHFDTASLGITDPETVEFDTVAGTLYIIGAGGDQVVEMTTTGTALRSIDTSAVPFSHPSGLVLAPGSADSSKRNLYVSDRKVDNDSNPNENDGKIFEIEIGATGGSTPDGVRVASSSDDAEEKPTGSVSLSSSDLELVYDGAVQTIGIRFTGIDVPQGASISAAWIQFEADEAQSEVTSLTIQGQAADNAPTFTTASFNVSSRPRTSALVAWFPMAWSAAGAAGPDQRTPDLSGVIQQIVNRPGWVAGNALAIVVTGTGHRTARAYDGKPLGAPLLHIEIGTGPLNRPPVVNAGPDQTVTWPGTAALHATVTDDHLPSPPDMVTTSWSTTSGPGEAAFADRAALDTSASFPAPGSYVLRLGADDGELSSSDSLTVTVRDPNTPIVFEKRVAGGSDDAEEKVSTHKVSLTSSDLEFVVESTLQIVGIRFTGIAVPPRAVISRAWVQFKADEAQSEVTSLTIEGQAAVNPAGFATLTGNISSRPRLPALVAWSPAPWTSGQAGPAQKTPDLAPIIQQIVDQPGWAGGNALVLVFKGSGHRTAESFEGQAAGAALLHIEYR
jgi:hypothetical protein